MCLVFWSTSCLDAIRWDGDGPILTSLARIDDLLSFTDVSTSTWMMAGVRLGVWSTASVVEAQTSFRISLSLDTFASGAEKCLETRDTKQPFFDFSPVARNPRLLQGWCSNRCNTLKSMVQMESVNDFTWGSSVARNWSKALTARFYGFVIPWYLIE